MNFLPKARSRTGNEQGFILILTLIILMLLTLFGIWAMQTSDTEIRVASNTQQMETANYLGEAASATEATLLGGESQVLQHNDEWKKQAKKGATDLNLVLMPNPGDFDPTGGTQNYPSKFGETDVDKFQAYEADLYKKAYAEAKTMGTSRRMDREYGNEEAFLQAHAEYWPTNNILVAEQRYKTGETPDLKNVDSSLSYKYLVTFLNHGDSPIVDASTIITESAGGRAGYSADQNVNLTAYWFRTQGKQLPKKGAGASVMERGVSTSGPRTN